MKILYDFRIFGFQDYGGISKYFLKICDFLNRENSVKVLSPIHVNKYINESKKEYLINFLYLKKRYRFTTKIIYWINYLYTSLYILIYKPDILHLTYYPEYLFKKRKLNYKLVITVFDLIHEIYLDKYNYKKNANLKNNIIYSADHIICISNNTKKDLIDFYKVEESKITVIYLGYETSKEITMIENINIIRPFFLYVGSRGRYKNFFKLLEAFSISKLLKNNLDIYCFGGGDFTTKELDIIKSLEIDQSQIKYFSGDDRKLNYLYSKAHAFVFPSLYEGFGLPLLEAMNMGCPVVCSNTSSFPEVVNDSALLFNPESKEDIKIKLEEIFKNVNLKQRLIEKGYNNLKRFSWKKCSEESLNVYKI
jgi:glycosyltransferase involved in cell wall biosynthesis